MPGTDHITQYSAADIQRYLDGKMLPAEMHALEQAALDDPFLADAMEGMQQTLTQHSSSLIDTHLQDLRQQLDERTRKESKAAPVIAFRWWQVAAAAVVVVTGSLWGYNYFLQEKNVSAIDHQLVVAKQESYRNTTPPAASATVPETAAPAAADSNILADGSAVAPESNTNNSLTQKEEKAIPSPDYKLTKKAPIVVKKQYAFTPDSTSSWKANASAMDKVTSNYSLSESKIDSTRLNMALRQLKKDNAIVTNNNKLSDNNASKVYNYSNSLDKAIKNKVVDYEQIVIAKTARDTTGLGFYTKPREQEMNRSRKELSERQAKKNPDALLSGFISGKVTDQANNPLSNALLRVDNNNKVFYTDQQGLFKIPVKDSVVNVAVGYTGYYSQNLQLQNNTDNNIALNQLGVKAPNPQLNDALKGTVQGIAVEGKDSDDRAKAVSLSRVDVDLAAAAVQPQYGWLKYQQYLEKNKRLPAGTPEATGTVVVSFQVTKKGTLSDFKIEQSLGKVYDEEAIRLIKAGPSWKLTRGRKAKATVQVQF
ncbi:hypothetical protein D3H65_14250 [Paraflavitalea soli]|uniref:TonB C-terminal domain-containing protein n=1 Tax=Paraflavitalea soli TaxID=2315862 RepID=A0A3B7MLH4_9BACT|nr:carboxypeptidase-like regulatory domain-containing protein [Paraflavitalea soli]AXY75068.1 hypothetical protein D3H65_14250 [Paraflavitalea soli]